MRKTTCTVICLTALALAPAFCQEAPAPPVPAQPPRPPMPPTAPGQPSAPAPGSSSFSERLQSIIKRAGTEATPESPLIRFNLDFPGGTPKELVAAIEKAMGRPLNAIVPEELAATKLPALKMSSVDVSQLFQALTAASRKSEAVISGGGGYGGMQSYQIANTGCGFRQGSEGKPSDDTIWYFYVERPVLPPVSSSAKVCRFYALAPYLDRGATVDDITTAIETGWKMLGDTSPPAISFHKDTKLLIAVGEPTKLETIDAALKALDGLRSSPVPPGRPPLASPGRRPAGQPKSEN